MTRSLAIVCEARADYETATALADRVLCAEVEWIEADVLGNYRRWCGFQELDLFLTIQHVPELARQKNIRARGKFDGNLIAPMNISDDLLSNFSTHFNRFPMAS